MLGEVHQTQTKIQSTIQGAARSQDERFESLQTGLQEVKLAVGELNRGRNSGSQGDEVLRNLVKSEFKGDIEFHVQRFQEDTREWVFSKVENWLDDRNSQNRVMVICGNAGMGKSVISAAVCKKMQVAGRLCGSHFIQHNNVRYRKPQLMLQSLACHMCHALPVFKLALVKQLTRNTGKDLNDMGVEELFALLFKEPLSSVEDPGRNMLTGTKMTVDQTDRYFNRLPELYGISYPSSHYLFSFLFCYTFCCSLFFFKAFFPLLVPATNSLYISSDTILSFFIA